MAMLAEPRKKTKYRLQPYTSLCKINKRCDGDTNSFGFKLMSSMGWAPGKGLGADESGEVDPIKLRLKNDSAGVGFKVSEHDAVSQQSEFQALLQQLNSGSTEDAVPKEQLKKNKIKSLEKMSEQSSVRVHYKKFTRSKDLSRASEKDLRSILGLATSERAQKKVVPEPELLPPSEDTTVKSGPELYVSAGSSEDYFKDRFNEYKSRKNGKGTKEDVTSAPDLNNSIKVESSKANKRRSVTWGDVDVSYVEKYIKDMADTSGSTDEALNSSVCLKEPTLKKKKKKKKKPVSIQICQDLTEQLLTQEEETKNDHCEGSFDENVPDIQPKEQSAPKKKKKKRKMQESNEENVPESIDSSKVQGEEEAADTNLQPTVPQKKKKKL